MSTSLVTDLTIFVLALLVGVEVIGKVPATLHTPLMSAANSIHGIVLAGALIIGVTADNAVGYVLAFIAAFFAAANVVGGYVVTGRMLKMFRRKPVAAGPGASGSDGGYVVTERILQLLRRKPTAAVPGSDGAAAATNSAATDDASADDASADDASADGKKP
jgi:NAD(P) transhydrogenase subunit alpha